MILLKNICSNFLIMFVVAFAQNAASQTSKQLDGKWTGTLDCDGPNFEKYKDGFQTGVLMDIVDGVGKGVSYLGNSWGPYIHKKFSLNVNEKNEVVISGEEAASSGFGLATYKITGTVNYPYIKAKGVYFSPSGQPYRNCSIELMKNIYSANNQSAEDVRRVDVPKNGDSNPLASNNVLSSQPINNAERLLAEQGLKEQQRRTEEAKLYEQQRIAQELKDRDAERLLAEQRLNEQQLAAQATKKNLSEPGTYANRKALVIGNDSYMSVAKLLNARADARAIAEGLKRVGYQVTLKTDLDQRALKAALRTFKNQIEGGDEVAIYYAGHGVQLANTNYLLPIDVVGESEDQLRDDAIPLQRILDDISERKVKFTLAMIDACRDNPFKGSGRSIGNSRGLTPTTAATGQMIVFSAGNGQQALDKLGTNDKDKNGVFTRVLLKQMESPGLTIDRLFRNVRSEVVGLAKSVGHDQVPAIYDQVVGDFYFKK